MGMTGFPRNPRESRVRGNPAGMEVNVAGLPRVWKKSYGISTEIKVNFTAMILYG